MERRTCTGALLLALILLALAPVVAAHSAPPASETSASAKVPAPVRGTVTTCSSNWDCKFAFNTSAGTGWAHGAGVSYYQRGLLSFQLPGEAKASYNLTYSTYIARLTGTYTYWTVGTFVGTDVNLGHVVYGTTNTNFTITCHGTGRGCTYTYTTDNGTVVVRFTNAQFTSTAISCSPTSTHPGGKVGCKLTVTNGWNRSNIPTGTVRISTGGTGSLSNKGVCTLANGTCSFTYVVSDNTCGSATLMASFLGNAAFYKSSGSILISVIVSGGC